MMAKHLDLIDTDVCGKEKPKRLPRAVVFARFPSAAGGLLSS